MMDDLEKQGWPVSPADINLLEKEIQQAQTFLLQSQDLRKKSEEVTSYNYSYGKIMVAYTYRVVNSNSTNCLSVRRPHEKLLNNNEKRAKTPKTSEWNRS